MLSHAISYFWFVQAIGAVSLVFICLAFISKTRSKMLVRQAIGNAILITHFILLGAYAGGLSNTVAIVRNLVFNQKEKHAWAAHKWWLYFFIALAVGSVLISWRGWVSLLPAIGVSIGAIGMWSNTPAKMRFYMLLTGIPWIPYTIIVHSYSGLIAQLVSLSFIVYGMIRFDRAKSKGAIL